LRTHKRGEKLQIVPENGTKNASANLLLLPFVPQKLSTQLVGQKQIEVQVQIGSLAKKATNS